MFLGKNKIGSHPLVDEVHKVFFPHIEIKYEDYFLKEGIEQNEKGRKKWWNYRIEVIILWSAVYHRKDILITKDENFHRNKDMIKKRRIIDVKKPHDFVSELKRI